MYDADPLSLLTREVLRERLPVLVAEACAWSVGLSDAPHVVRRGSRLVQDGTLALRALAGLPLGDESDGRIDLADAPVGSFGDALNALDGAGRLHAERFEAEVLEPFVLQTCVLAAERAGAVQPAAWEELLDELGEDGSDLEEVVRGAEWEAPLRTEAGLLVLGALGAVPLVEVEAEGLPLSLVRAAEAELRAAAEPALPPVRSEEELAGALFLAEAAVAALPVPVPPEHAPDLLQALRAEGLEPEEVLAVLPLLPVLADTADEVAARLAEQPPPV